MDGQFTEDEDGDQNKRGVISGGELLGGDLERMYGWPSSRIVRVSRASGGKDRHSKVLTSKGLRDRRVRLSVNTAIQFYDLQDRLGYDQPSKALEWLLKAAADSIDELPPMNNPFAVISNHFRDEKRCSAAGSDRMAEIDVDDGNRAIDLGFPQPQMTKSSACSSTSETSKGSGGLSLSRSERRNKAREWGKVRVVAEENESSHMAGELNYISQATTFTELLSGGINNANNNQSSTGANANGPNFFLKSPRNWSSSPMDYFSSGLLDHTAARSGQMHLNASNPFMPVSSSSLFTMVADHQPELQHFSFLPELVPGVNAAGGGSNNDGIPPNLNFTISGNSSGSLAGFNREALQSNSSPPSSLLPQLHRFSDGSQQGFYLENHHNHQFLHKYDARLQLCYGDAHCDNDTIGGSHSGQKGKSKS